MEWPLCLDYKNIFSGLEWDLPIRTDKKNSLIGMFRIGATIFRNQFGVQGNIRKDIKT